MATPNYSYEKRQRELAKKRKKEEKQKRKSSDAPAVDSPAGNEGQPIGGPTGTPPSGGGNA